MRKKIFGLLFILSLSLVGCNLSKEDDIKYFYFDNLSIDLDGAVSLGISERTIDVEAQNKSNSFVFNTQDVSADVKDETYVLTRVDESGNAVEIVYYDEDDNEVLVPMNVLTLDVIGDYIFIVYVSDLYVNYFCPDDFQDCSVNHDESLYSNGMKEIFSWLDETLAYKEGEELTYMRFIAVEKNSGKMFDFGSVFSQFTYIDENGETVYLDSVTPYVYDDMIYINSGWKNGLIAVLKFNEVSMEMDIETFSPSAEGVQFLFTTPKGTTFIKMDNDYHYLLADHLTFGDWKDYFPKFNDKLEKIFIDLSYTDTNPENVEIYGIKGYILSPATDRINYFLETSHGNFLVVTSNEDTIEYVLELEGINSDARILKISDELIIYDNLLIDLESQTMEEVSFSSDGDSFYISNSTVLVMSNRNLYSINYATKSVFLIDENITIEYDENDVNKDFYISYSVNIGISKVFKKVSYSSGEVIVGDFIPPSVHVFSVKPLN